MNPVDMLKRTSNLSGPPQQPPGRPGFTWLEVLMTLGVLALGCLAVLNLQKSAVTESYQTDHLTIVNFLAESQLEILKAMDYDQLDEAKNRTSKVNRYGQQCREENDGLCYELALSIEAEKSGCNSRLVRLEIKWPDRRGMETRVFEAAITDFTI